MKYGGVKNISKELLSDNWYSLHRVTFDYQCENGQWQTQVREAYNRGNGAAILLYNAQTKKVVLTRQFRMPTYLNGNTDGMMVEVCAGVLEDGNPEETIKREVAEETGYAIEKVKKVFESYMSPGSVTEILHFFVGEYNETMRVSSGGGAAGETEHIEVLEMPFSVALDMVDTGEIKDAKTIMLLQWAKINALFNSQNSRQ